MAPPMSKHQRQAFTNIFPKNPIADTSKTDSNPSSTSILLSNLWKMRSVLCFVTLSWSSPSPSHVLYMSPSIPRLLTTATVTVSHSTRPTHPAPIARRRGTRGRVLGGLRGFGPSLPAWGGAAIFTPWTTTRPPPSPGPPLPRGNAGLGSSCTWPPRVGTGGPS